MSLPFEHLEEAYDLIARAIDAAGPERERVLLAKLCLCLADRLGDIAAVRECISGAVEAGS